MARILGGNPGHLAQNVYRTLRHIAEISERGRDYI